ncbi:hypothetical protein ABIE33_006924 [Ensifer sp. 4252]
MGTPELMGREKTSVDDPCLAPLAVPACHHTNKNGPAVAGVPSVLGLPESGANFELDGEALTHEPQGRGRWFRLPTAECIAQKEDLVSEIYRAIYGGKDANILSPPLTSSRETFCSVKWA